MVWEFPAVSQTRIDFWGEPQYTRKGMLVFTALFGAFGLHHLLLRSPQTALLFFFTNIFTLGYCYWFDVLQLTGTPTKDLNEYGLALPWGAAGIAKGMWMCGPQKEKEKESAVPSPWWFSLYSLLLPLGPIASLAAGDSGGALAKFLGVLFIIILFPFTFMSLGYDYYRLLVKPADLAFNGASRFFPFTVFGWDNENRSKNIQSPLRPDNPECSSSGGILGSILNFLASLLQAVVVFVLPYISWILPPDVLAALTSIGDTAKVINKEVVPTVLKTADAVTTKAIPLAEKAVDSAVKIGTLAVEVPTKMASALESAGIQAKQAGQMAGLQSGGGTISSGDKLALGGIAALLGGGFLLTMGRSFNETIFHFNGPSDTPPEKPRRV